MNKYKTYINDPVVNLKYPFTYSYLKNKIDLSTDVPRYITVAVGVYRSSYYFSTNNYKTNPSFKKKHNNGIDYYGHAEMNLLSSFPRNFKFRKIKIFISRFPKVERTLTLARPCIFCQRHMSEKGILPKNVFYTDSKGNWRNLLKFDKIND